MFKTQQRRQGDSILCLGCYSVYTLADQRLDEGAKEELRKNLSKLHIWELFKDDIPARDRCHTKTYQMFSVVIVYSAMKRDALELR